MIFKYVVRNTAHQYGKTVTFMPKPIFQDNGNGMHTHQSLWLKGKPLFAGEAYAGLSQTALWYIGGLLKHAPALAALIAPTTNSYKRLVPGFEAPVNLAYSRRNRSAAVRIPMYSASPKAKRIEFRPPDPSCNPYLAYSAMLMAGLDGVENKIDPGQPLDKDIYDLSPEELKNVPSMPGSLEESLKRAGTRSQVPAQGRRLQPGPHSSVDRIQNEKRGERRAHAAASVRISAVLRHLRRPQNRTARGAQLRFTGRLFLFCGDARIGGSENDDAQFDDSIGGDCGEFCMRDDGAGRARLGGGK